MKAGTYSAAKILGIWHHGCGNTIPFQRGPWRCGECTRGMFAAAARSALRLHLWGNDTRSPVARAFGRVLCLFGEHDLHADCEGFEADGPPVGHASHPAPGDSAAVIIHKFSEWTRLRCRRCSYTYPKK